MVLMDGRVVEGAVSRWQDDAVELTADGGTMQIPAEEILRVRFAPAGDVAPELTVELIDGSVLPIETFAARDRTATLKVATAEEPIEVGTNLIAAVHLQPPTPAIAAQWNELRATGEAGDVIVIRKDGAVDHLAGRLGNVTESHVMFYLDGEEFPVERGRVDGLVYYHAQESQFGEPLCVVRGSHGMRLTLAAAALEGDELRARTASGLRLTVGINSVESVDFSAGKLLYLSELTPRSVETTPLVAFPASAQIAARFGQPVLDRGFFETEARLRYPQENEGRATTWQLKSHTRSVGLRSRSEVVYTLPDGFRRFRATAGIDGTLGGRGNVYLAIYGDDRLLWEQSIDGSEPPVPIDLDVAGVRRLRILVDYGEGGDAADRLYLCDARITK